MLFFIFHSYFDWRLIFFTLITKIFFLIVGDLLPYRLDNLDLLRQPEGKERFQWPITVNHLSKYELFQWYFIRFGDPNAPMVLNYTKNIESRLPWFTSKICLFFDTVCSEIFDSALTWTNITKTVFSKIQKLLNDFLSIETQFMFNVLTALFKCFTLYVQVIFNLTIHEKFLKIFVSILNWHCFANIS